MKAERLQGGNVGYLGSCWFVDLWVSSSARSVDQFKKWASYYDSKFGSLMKFGASIFSALVTQAATLSFDGSLPALHTHWAPKVPTIDVPTAAEAAAVEASWLPQEEDKDLKRKEWKKARAARHKAKLEKLNEQSEASFLSQPVLSPEGHFAPPSTPSVPQPSPETPNASPDLPATPPPSFLSEFPNLDYVVDEQVRFDLFFRCKISLMES